MRAASRSRRTLSAGWRAARPASSGRWPRLARSRARHPLVPRGGRRRAGDVGRMKREGELPETLVLKTSVLLPCRTRRPHGRSRSSARDDQRLHGPLAGRARRAARSVLGAARRLRRGPGRPGRLRTLLRGAGDDPAAAPVYVKLGVRNAPNIYPAGLHLQELAGSSAASASAGPSSCCACCGSRHRSSSRAAAMTARDLGSRAVKERFDAIYTAALADILDTRGHRDQTLPPSIRPLAPGLRLAGPAYTVLGRPAETADHDDGASQGAAMLGEVPQGHVAVYACAQDVSAHLGELSVTSLKARGVAGCVLDGGCRDVRFILDEGFPSSPLRDAGGLDVALGARGDAGAGDDRTGPGRARRLGCRRRRRRRGRATGNRREGPRRGGSESCDRERDPRSRPRRRFATGPTSVTARSRPEVTGVRDESETRDSGHPCQRRV